VLGFMISVGLVLIRVFLRRGIESPEQLEEIGISVYASIPVSESFTKKINNSNKVKNVKAAEYQGFLALDNPADIALEAIRGLRTSLHFA
ncbi:tyrosine-protein kinase, partial [Escherichia coli]